MKIFLVGQRGIGKSSFLARIKKETTLACFDLDQEIEKMYQESIASIFARLGESTFREYEKQCLQILMSQHEQFIMALGAGYQGDYPEDVTVIWLRRVTEKHPRVFFDRPRLYPEFSPHEEYQKIYDERFEKFKTRSHFQFYMEEGNFNTPSLFYASEVSGIVTALPSMNLEIISTLYQLRLVEYRDDIAVQHQPLRSGALFSYRMKPPIKQNDFEDFGLELGKPSRRFSIISKHERTEGESLASFFAELEKYSEYGDQLKAAPMIESFEELYVGHVWQQKDPVKRSFLPRSYHGKWKWYRLFMKDKMPLNFYRFDGEHNLDQPLFHEWVTTLSSDTFAGVLGTPIEHSYSPAYHKSFFASIGIPFFAIKVERSEREIALSILKKMGLRFAAITSPLKQEGINTLYIHHNLSEETVNTDLKALSHCLKKYDLPQPIAIWGNGEMAQNIQKFYPQAVIYSARQGAVDCQQARTLIWACGNHERFVFPDNPHRLTTVFDLSYIPWSMGKDFAFANKLHYISGEELFLTQAQEQQIFWQSFIKEKKDE